VNSLNRQSWEVIVKERIKGNIVVVVLCGFFWKVVCSLV
jgi:hypothetical protein